MDEPQPDGGVPPRGYATLGPDGPAVEDLQALAALIESLRGLLPPDFQENLTDLVRTLLLLARALIDRALEQLDGEHGTEPGVEESPPA